MKISLIVAVAQNGVIGNNNQLIWRLPEDLKMFKRLTSGHVIIMGRKTFDSIGKPLPNRTSIVISRNADLQIEGCFVVSSLEEALSKAQQLEPTEAFVIGGAEIYRLALPLADCIYQTEVHGDFDGDAFFPKLTNDRWQAKSRISYSPDEKHLYAFDFVEYERIR